MAGQRQPIELLLIKGKKHLTKAEIEERKKREVKAKADKIEPPSILTKKQKKRFQEIAKELIDINIMSNLDVDALARFVIHQTEYERVTKLIRKTNPLDDLYNKLLVQQEKHFKMARQCSMDLGLTISSRCKLVIPKQDEDKKPKTEEEELFGDAL